MNAADVGLLEMAAKAAAYSIYWHHADQCHHKVSGGVDSKWIPLDDDGDALRLAVAIQQHAGCTVTTISIGKTRSGCEFKFIDGPDSAANTRRAIVTAAAEIGWCMP